MGCLLKVVPERLHGLLVGVVEILENPDADQVVPPELVEALDDWPGPFVLLLELERRGGEVGSYLAADERLLGVRRGKRDEVFVERMRIAWLSFDRAATMFAGFNMRKLRKSLVRPAVYNYNLDVPVSQGYVSHFVH